MAIDKEPKEPAGVTFRNDEARIIVLRCQDPRSNEVAEVVCVPTKEVRIPGYLVEAFNRNPLAAALMARLEKV